MGASDSVVFYRSPHIPQTAVPVNPNPSQEVVIRLRNPEQFYKACSKLNACGISITGVKQPNSEQDPCYLWLKKSPALDNLTGTHTCAGFETLPCPTNLSKGSHAVELTGESTYLDLEETRKDYEQRGFHVSAQSSPTEFGTKTVYFTS